MTSMQTTATQRERPLSRIKKRRAPARSSFTLATPQTRTTRAKKTEARASYLSSRKKKKQDRHPRPTITPVTAEADGHALHREKKSYVQLKWATAATSHSPTSPRRRRRGGGSNPNHPTRIAMCKKKKPVATDRGKQTVVFHPHRYAEPVVRAGEQRQQGLPRAIGTDARGQTPKYGAELSLSKVNAPATSALPTLAFPSA